jgi:hypothetical protein
MTIMINGPLIKRMAGITPREWLGLGHKRYHNRSDVKLDVNASAFPALPEIYMYIHCANKAEADPITAHKTG